MRPGFCSQYGCLLVSLEMYSIGFKSISHDLSICFPWIPDKAKFLIIISLKLLNSNYGLFFNRRKDYRTREVNSETLSQIPLQDYCLGCSAFCFSRLQRASWRWSQLTRWVVDSPSLDVSKWRLICHLSEMVECEFLHWAGRWILLSKWLLPILCFFVLFLGL